MYTDNNLLDIGGHEEQQDGAIVATPVVPGDTFFGNPSGTLAGQIGASSADRRSGAAATVVAAISNDMLMGSQALAQPFPTLPGTDVEKTFFESQNGSLREKNALLIAEIKTLKRKLKDLTRSQRRLRARNRALQGRVAGLEAANETLTANETLRQQTLSIECSLRSAFFQLFGRKSGHPAIYSPARFVEKKNSNTLTTFKLVVCGLISYLQAALRYTEKQVKDYFDELNEDNEEKVTAAWDDAFEHVIQPLDKRIRPDWKASLVYRRFRHARGSDQTTTRNEVLKKYNILDDSGASSNKRPRLSSAGS